ncbi:MAG: type II toxin-antitoxin system VapC family toxin [Propioniciclava sp.]|uniref:type II toxin-antitoxin system VapC family toxin n=1 Tax=Propioniciclava sp. TaxID=2038686 RepID=UPI0039E70FDB
MIVLDTNVVSELLRGPEADPRVVAWLSSLGERPVTTVLTRAEILSGVALLPPGARRERLEMGVRKILTQLGVCLPLTDEAADHYAEIVALRRTSGRPVSGFDALIAAICRTASATLATRNTKDFVGVGVDLVDPWGEPASCR